MASLSVTVSDSDVIKMVEEFLAARHLDIALMCLERESGIINGCYSEDALFLRQLILDGQWDDALEFLQPLETVTEFDSKRCQYLIYKHKYLEQLCIKQDPGPLQNHEFTLDEVVSCLTALEDLCPSRKVYDQLCFLLTLPSLSSDPEYKDWNPSSARLRCFHELYPLLKKFIGIPSQTKSTTSSNTSSKNDRLVNLIVKGLLYEMSVDLCTARACGESTSPRVPQVLIGSPCMDADLSLVSWLQQVPLGSFACPFEKKSLRLNVNRLEKPALEATWSEQLLNTPIRPKQFPHSAIPARTKQAQLISQSMMALYDGLSHDLSNQGGMFGSRTDPRSSTYISPHISRSLAASLSLPRHFTRSLHVDRRNDPMNRSLEQLFVSSSPRLPRGSSPLTRETKTNEIISPPPTQTSSIEKTLQEETPSKSNTPPAILNPQSTNNGSHGSITNKQKLSQSAGSNHDNQSTNSNHHNLNAHNADKLFNNKSVKHSTPPPAPIKSQHSTREPIRSQDNSASLHQPMKSSQISNDPIKRASGDLFNQYQEQKERMAEKFKEQEDREEQWRQLQTQSAPINQSVVYGDNHMTASIPKLDLNISVDPAGVSQPAEEPELQGYDLIEEDSIKQFVPVETLVEQGPIRAVAFHPNGNSYAVGSNTKVLRVCQFPDVSKVTTSYNQTAKRPNILAKKVKHHSGSIYTVNFNPSGSLIATGSNDHMIRCTQWIEEQMCFGTDREIAVHDGTIRDVCFLTDNLLLSGGAGDCSICLTDVNANKVVRRYQGHASHVLTLYSLSDSQRFVSGGQDARALLWDTRMSVPVQNYTHDPENGGSASAFASVCTDPRSLVLAAGHDNSRCSIYDLRQSRILQTWKPHTDEVRSVRFNNDATYFLTGSYDTTVKLMDMQGDITQSLRTVQVAEHSDKVIQVRCHPILPSFITSSADRTVTCWAIQIDP